MEEQARVLKPLSQIVSHKADAILTFIRHNAPVVKFRVF